MTENVISFPGHLDHDCSPAAGHSRLIFRIGAKRFAFEFVSSATEINPLGAKILKIEHFRMLKSKRSIPKEFNKGEGNR